MDIDVLGPLFDQFEISDDIVESFMSALMAGIKQDVNVHPKEFDR